MITSKSYLSVRDTQEWQLKQEVEQEGNHSRSADTLILGDMIGDVCKAGPDSS